MNIMRAFEDMTYADLRDERKWIREHLEALKEIGSIYAINAHQNNLDEVEAEIKRRDTEEDPQ